VALRTFLKEPRIFNGNGRLRRKHGEERAILRRKAWPDSASATTSTPMS
jgi:hypothetical protein